MTLTLKPKAAEPKIIGLKVEGSANDGLDKLFSDSDSNPAELSLCAKKETKLTPLVNPSKPKKFTSVKTFFEVTPMINSLCLSLSDFEPPPLTPDVDFIPAGTAPEALVAALAKFIETKDGVAFETSIAAFDLTHLPESISAQVSLVRHVYNKSVSLLHFIDLELDPCVSSLVHYVVSSELGPSEAAAQCLLAATDYTKSPALAPIAVLFADFTIPKIIATLCRFLIKIFPKHPLLPSMIHKLGTFSGCEESLLAEIPPEKKEEESDFSSDFFDDLKPKLPSSNGSSSVVSLSDYASTNPLDFSPAAIGQIQVVTMPDPPSTMIFALKGGADKMNPTEFTEWILSCRVKETTNYPLSDSGRLDREMSTPLLRPIIVDQSKSGRLDELYQKVCRGLDIQVLLPNASEPCDWGRVLPLLHLVNANSSSAYSNSSYPVRLLQAEIDAHHGVVKSDLALLDSSMSYFVEQITSDLATKPVEPLTEKKPFVPSFEPLSPKVIQLICLMDACLLISGRSPLTLLPSPGVPAINSQAAQHPIFRSNWASSVIFNTLLTEPLPPYIAFRALFTLAVNFFDSNASFSSRLIFEAIYLFFSEISAFSSTPWALASFFFFGEALDACKKYYYCALVHDNSWMISGPTSLLITKAAKIAQTNHDTVRALFYYTEAIRHFIETHQNDELIYTAQIVASIYQSNDQSLEGIKFLLFILKDVYRLKVSRMKMSYDIHRQLGSMTSPKKPRPYDSSLPRADGINSIMSALTLCELLIKVRQFNSASTVIRHMEKEIQLPSVKKMLLFMNGKISYAKNRFDDFLAVMALQNLKSRPRSQTMKFASSSAFMFDTTIPSLKLLTRGYIERRDGVRSLFWAEMVCASALHSGNLKEIALGFLLRGISLFELITTFYRYSDASVLALEQSELESSFGEFDSTKHPNRKDFLREALSSFLLSQTYYDKIGNSPKSLEALLNFCETLVFFIFTETHYDGKTIEPIELKSPSLFTKAKIAPSVEMIIEPQTLNQSNCIERLTSLSTSFSRSAGTFIEPRWIIRSQILNGYINFLRGKMPASQSCFEYAFDNMKKLFFNGNRFLARDLSQFRLLNFLHISTNLCMLLSSYSKDFINAHLIAFDMRNDISALYANRIRSVIEESDVNIDPKAELFASIFDLKNPSFPDFQAIALREYPSLDSPMKARVTRKLEISAYLSQIRKNLRSFIEGKETETSLKEKNSDLVRKIEAAANDRRRTRNSLIMTELPPTSSEAVVFLVLLYDRIVSYVPQSGERRVTRLIRSSHSEVVNLGSMSLNCGSGVFPFPLLQYISKILTGEDTRNNDVGSYCVAVGRVLFGNISTKSLEVSTVPDGHLLGEMKFFGKGLKGALSTLNVNPTALSIVIDNNLHALPFELMFPSVTVVRNHFFFNSFIRPRSDGPMRPIALRFQKGKDDLTMRNNELIQYCFSVLGASEMPSYFVSGLERRASFPLSVFDATKDTEKYSKEFSFCDFVDTDMTRFGELKEGLFIFTLGDLAEFPPFLDVLLHMIPTAYFMFIPNGVMKDAFNEMQAIADRHQRRMEYFKKNPDDPQAQENLAVLQSHFQFVATLQRTLIKKYNSPIAVLLPSRTLPGK